MYIYQEMLEIVLDMNNIIQGRNTSTVTHLIRQNPMKEIDDNWMEVITLINCDCDFLLLNDVSLLSL